MDAHPYTHECDGRTVTFWSPSDLRMEGPHVLPEDREWSFATDRLASAAAFDFLTAGTLPDPEEAPTS
jgi:hypothetical protein